MVQVTNTTRHLIPARALLQRIGTGHDTRDIRTKIKKPVYREKAVEDAVRWGLLQEQAALGDVEPQVLFQWTYGIEMNLFLDGHPELRAMITEYAVDLVRDMERDSVGIKYTSAVEDRATYKNQAAVIRRRADEIRMENLQRVPPIWKLLDDKVASMPKSTIRDGLRVCVTTCRNGGGRAQFINAMTRITKKYDGYEDMIADKAVALINEQIELIQGQRF